MSDVGKLYQDAILEHSRNPRNATLPEATDHRAEGHNPLCGDRVTVAVELRGDVIAAIGFDGVGCAISLAAASMMTQAVEGVTVARARELGQRFEALVTGAGPEAEAKADAEAGAGEGRSVVEELAVFAGVVEYPMRRRCATLCWETLSRALDKQDR